MPLVAKKTSAASIAFNGVPGPKKKLAGLQRKGLRDVSNLSYEVIKSKTEITCKHGQRLKDWPNVKNQNGSSKTINSGVPFKPFSYPKFNLIQLEKNDSKKEIIEDIDKLYEGNVFLVREYAKHIYQYLTKIEAKFKLYKWPLKSSLISSGMRTILVDWLVDIHVEYHLLQETIHLAVYILDKYIQSDHSLDKSTFQLVGLCSLYLASKYEEMFSPMMEDFISLCKTTYTKKQFFMIEQNILRAVNFNLGRPASVLFLRRFNMAAKADKMQHFYSKYFIDLVLLDSHFCHIRPSLVAASAVYLAMCIVKTKSDPSLWNATMVHYSSYTYNDIKPVKSMLVRLIFTTTRTKFDSVKRKYATSSLQGVSVKIDAYLELLKRVLLD